MRARRTLQDLRHASQNCTDAQRALATFEEHDRDSGEVEDAHTRHADALAEMETSLRQRDLQLEVSSLHHLPLVLSS